MSEYREQCIEHKKMQAGIVDVRPVAPKSKKDRKVVLELYRVKAARWGSWGRYAKPEQAHMAARKLLRGAFLQFDKSKYRVDGQEFQTSDALDRRLCSSHQEASV